MNEKIDLKNDYKILFCASVKDVTFVGIPAFNFLMIDGIGDPNSQNFQNSVAALYSIAYSIKFSCKKNPQLFDFTVPPLEGLWYFEENSDYLKVAREKWQWTLLIMMPEFVTSEIFEKAKTEVSKKKENELVDNVRFELFDEGACAQIMHIGSYATEEPTVEKLHKTIKKAGYKLSGKHHEIYLSDPRKTAPEKLKTIIRQPIEKVEE
ncbi:MAG TPA: GyrI-like domain-containing protein [Melioribacteraceae bacterium]|nr:GyrI-like domain-containing protein [Melioribacteraceae bacterium]